MTKREFQKISIGDIVITNGLCRVNSGIRCKITYICEDRIWIKPIDGQKFNSDNEWCSDDWNEISYRAVNTIKG